MKAQGLVILDVSLNERGKCWGESGTSLRHCRMMEKGARWLLK